MIHSFKRMIAAELVQYIYVCHVFTYSLLYFATETKLFLWHLGNHLVLFDCVARFKKKTTQETCA